MLPAMLSAVAVAGSGCSASKVDSTTSAGTVKISGTLSSGTVSRLSSRLLDNSNIDDILASVSITSFGVRCVTLSGDPQAGEGECDSSGSFSLSLASATGVPIG